jgi:hypothetical protein
MLSYTKKKIKAAKLGFQQVGPTNQDFVEAVEYKHKVVSGRFNPSLQNQNQNFQTIMTTLATIQTNMTTLQTSITTIQGTMSTLEQRLSERMQNFGKVYDDDTITTLVGINGQYPNPFPATIWELAHLMDAQLNTLLQAYGLTPVHPTNVVQRRQQLAYFFGMRVTMHE